MTKSDGPNGCLACLGGMLISGLSVVGKLADEGADVGRRALKHAPPPSRVVRPQTSRFLEMTDVADVDFFPKGSQYHFVRSSDLYSMTQSEPIPGASGNSHAMVTVTRIVPKALKAGEQVEDLLPLLPESEDQYEEAEQVDGVTYRWVQ
ncbi:MAG: hypothetical protein ACF787_08960 [Rhodopirellula sp. JB053]